MSGFELYLFCWIGLFFLVKVVQQLIPRTVTETYTPPNEVYYERDAENVIEEVDVETLEIASHTSTVGSLVPDDMAAVSSNRPKGPMEEFIEGVVREAMAEKKCDHKIVTGYRPAWLTNPSTNRRLELDLYIPALRFAIESSGIQHVTTYRNVSPTVQMGRDTTKGELCTKYGVTLFVVYNSRIRSAKDETINEIRAHVFKAIERHS